MVGAAMAIEASLLIPVLALDLALVLSTRTMVSRSPTSRALLSWNRRMPRLPLPSAALAKIEPPPSPTPVCA